MTNLAMGNRGESIRDIVAKTIIDGDLARLQPREGVSYYMAVCQSLGLNPLSKPFKLIRLNEKLILYARKDSCVVVRRSRLKLENGFFILFGSLAISRHSVDSANG